MSVEAPPRPGFLSGFLPTLERALGTVFRGKRPIVLLLLLAVPLVLRPLVPAGGPERMFRAELSIVALLYFQMIVPLVGLTLGTAVLLDETTGGTLPYLFTRPVPRSGIVLAKLVAAVVPACVAVALSLGVSRLLWGDAAAAPPGFGNRALLAAALAVPAYLTGFALLSALTRWGVLIGLLWVFGVELTLGLIPGQIRKVTLVHYARSILEVWPRESSRWQELLLGQQRADPGTAVAILAGTTVVFAALTVWIVSRREYVTRNEST